MGVIGNSLLLVQSDAEAGSPATFYPVSSFRRIDFSAGDSFTISPDLRTLSVDFRQSGGIDQLRVFTAAPSLPVAASGFDGSPELQGHELQGQIAGTRDKLQGHNT